jgi:hypothetical protein
MRESEQALHDRGITVWVASMTDHALSFAKQRPFWASWVSDQRLYPTVPDAVAAYRRRGEVTTPAPESRRPPA